MIVTTATATTSELGPLSRVVVQYCDLIESRATATGVATIDWEPLSELVAVDKFQRIGAYQEIMNWKEYTRFLTEWAGKTRFETSVYRITEVGRVVYQTLEERHYKGDDFIAKNVIAVYLFDDDDRIRHLDIDEQARDTGQWIVEAARASVDPESKA